jgi:hypothetical protein
VVVYASDGWTFDFVNNNLIWFFFLNFRIKETPVPDFGGKIKFTTARSGYFKILKDPVVFMKLGGYIGL